MNIPSSAKNKHLPCGKVVEDIKALTSECKCRRCYKYHKECSEWGSYNVCYRCQDVLTLEHNDFCCGCGVKDDRVKDNLCPECRATRISEYDQRLRGNG